MKLLTRPSYLELLCSLLPRQCFSSGNNEPEGQKTACKNVPCFCCIRMARPELQLHSTWKKLSPPFWNPQKNEKESTLEPRLAGLGLS